MVTLTPNETPTRSKAYQCLTLSPGLPEQHQQCSREKYPKLEVTGEADVFRVGHLLVLGVPGL